MDLVERVQLARESMGNLNCVGTAFYILGRIDREIYIEPYSTEFFLKNSQLLSEPDEPCLILFGKIDRTYKNFYVRHAGVITNETPLLMCHRMGFNGPLVENESTDDFLKCYNFVVQFWKVPEINLGIH